MPAVRVNGHVLHSRLDGPWEDGGGATLVFSNSLGTDFRIWDPLLPYLPEDWRLLRYDTAGHGLSEDPGAYSIADHAADLAGLMSQLGIEKAVIVGLSVGGQIAQALAAKKPERVTGLVLCDTAPRIGSWDFWEDRIAAVRQQGLAAVGDAILERWFTQRFREENADDFALWRAMLLRTPEASDLGLCAALRDADLSDAAKALRLPPLCVVGAEEGATPPDLVRAMAESIPASRYAEIPGAGHLPCIETPERLAGLLRDFMKEAQLA